MVLAIHAPALPEADDELIVSIEVVDGQDAQGDAELGVSPQAIAQALEGHIGDLGYRVRILGPTDVRVTDASHVNIRVRTATDHAWEVEFQRGDAPSWTRRLPPQSDVDLRLEALGVIVRGILEDAPSTPAPEQPQPLAPVERAEPQPDPTAEKAAAAEVEPPDPVPKAAHTIRVALGYRADSFAQRMQHGVAAGLGWQHPLGPTVLADVAWVPPQASNDLLVQRVPLQIGLGWRFRRSKRLTPAVLAGATVEALGWRGAPAGSQAAPGWAARTAIFVAAEAAFELTEQVFAFARVTGRGWVQSASLLERNAQGGDTTLLEPARFSGAGLLGLGVRFSVGADRRAGAR